MDLIQPLPLHGTTLTIRPVVSDDKQMMRDAFERLSERSRHNRFLTATQSLTRSQLAYLTEVDQVHHVAFGVMQGADPIAVGRWIRFDAGADGDGDRDSADVAVTVVDAHQGRGIGTALIQVLALAARHRRVRWLHFDVLASNDAMLRLLDKAGAVRTDSGPIIHAVLDTQSVSLPDGIGAEILDRLDHAASLAG